MNKRCISALTAVVLVLSIAFSFFAIPQPVYAAKKMPEKLYKLVKGKWYTQASSGGYDVKFTKTKVKFYEHGKDEPCYTGKIKKVVKIKKGEYKNRYRIVYKNKNGICSFISNNKKATGFDYYFGEKGYDEYSGSGSLAIGRWQD